MHTKQCLAAAMSAAIENLRDSDEYTDFDFRIAIQDNVPLQWVDGWYEDSTFTCICGKGLKSVATLRYE